MRNIRKMIVNTRTRFIQRDIEKHLIVLANALGIEVEDLILLGKEDDLLRAKKFKRVA